MEYRVRCAARTLSPELISGRSFPCSRNQPVLVASFWEVVGNFIRLRDKSTLNTLFINMLRRTFWSACPRFRTQLSNLLLVGKLQNSKHFTLVGMVTKTIAPLPLPSYSPYLTLLSFLKPRISKIRSRGVNFYLGHCCSSKIWELLPHKFLSFRWVYSLNLKQPTVSPIFLNDACSQIIL